MTKLLQFCLHHHLHHSKSNLVPAWHEDSQRCSLESLLRRQDLGDLLHHPRLHLAVVKLSPLSPPPALRQVPKLYKKWNHQNLEKFLCNYHIMIFNLFNCVDLFHILNMIEILNICSEDGWSQSIVWKTRNESNYAMRGTFDQNGRAPRYITHSICMHLWDAKFWLKAIQCYSSKNEKTKLNRP